MPPGIRPDALDCHRALERRFSKAIQEGRMSLSFFFFSETYIVILMIFRIYYHSTLWPDSPTVQSTFTEKGNN